MSCIYDAQDYHGYGVTYKSSEYDDRFVNSVARWAERFPVEMETSMLDSLNPISMRGFLLGFESACGRNQIRKDATLLLLPFFLEILASAFLNSRIAIFKVSQIKQ